MKILAVIPARYGSQRLPGKVMSQIGDRPMIQWVYEAAKNCADFEQVVVATDNQIVADCVRQFGGEVEMTRANHITGTDRVAEVAERYPEMTAIANVQGDQPFVTPEILSQLVSPYLKGESPEMTTVACPLEMNAGYQDPNTVKVLCDRYNRAIYFSRASIPYFRNTVDVPVFHHLGLYAFRQDFLSIYASLEPTPIELAEGLEQLRAIEHGFAIQVCPIKQALLEVNTFDELLKARSLATKID
ncbi:MAG TPA: 3-deoxy-manno-octulosonate cytidylyltransferase [Coleofasciculaceae cyanobacterium]|jgi:3-deoxy-manno-octulosonate cytidylyltransferase (CMP-KDO synthetase)